MRNERKEIEMKQKHSGEGRERERERGVEEREEGTVGWKIDGPIEKEIQRNEGESEMDVAFRQGKKKKHIRDNFFFFLRSVNICHMPLPL